MELDKVEWETDKKELFNASPKALYAVNYENRTGLTQQNSVKYEDSVSHTSEFTWGFGLSAKVTTEAKGMFCDHR